jgi:hypothetical protein
VISMTGEPSSSLTSERSDEVGLFDIVVNKETRERPKWNNTLLLDYLLDCLEINIY